MMKIIQMENQNRTLTGGRTTRSGGVATQQKEISRKVDTLTQDLGRFREAKVEISNRLQSGVWERGSSVKIVISTRDLMSALTPEIRKVVNQTINYKSD